MKKIILLISASMLTAAAVFADSGTFGTISWKIENDTLTVSGTGATGYPNPWDSREDFKHIVIKNGITELGHSSFYHCGGNILTYDIPASVTTISDGALTNNENVTTITVHWTENIPTIARVHSEWGEDFIMGIFAYGSGRNFDDITLSVPYGVAADRYRNAEGWKDFNIVSRTEPDITGIAETPAARPQAVGYYDTLGRRLAAPPAGGVYIILYDNGATEKVMR